MARKSLNDIYEKLEEMYLDCMVTGISAALKKEWGEGWFEKLKAVDAANAKVNEYRYVIGPRTPNIDGLDFQACTKILYFLEDARNAVYHAQHYNPDNDPDVLARDLEEYDTVIMGRNVNAHKTRAAKKKKDPNACKLELVNSMYYVISHLFSHIKKPYDDASRTYETIFKSYKKRFESELDKKAFLFNKYFDPEKYDYRDFLLACDTIGIDWERIEGKFWFYSDDFDADIKRLRNQLAIDSDLARATLYAPVQHGEASPTPEESSENITSAETAPLKAEPQPIEAIDAMVAEDEPHEENDSFFQVPFVILIALAVAVVVFLSILLINRFGNKIPSDEFTGNTPPSSTTLFIDKD